MPGTGMRGRGVFAHRETTSRPRDAQAPTSKDANAGHFSEHAVATSLGGRERKGRTTHRSRAAPLDRWMEFLRRNPAIGNCAPEGKRAIVPLSVSLLHPLLDELFGS